MKRAKPVTLRQFGEWLKNNVSKTWFTGYEIGEEDQKLKFNFEDGGFASKPGHTPLIKYIHPVVDCRDMKVFLIKFRGSMEETTVSIHDEYDGNILELFESKFPDVFGKKG